MKESFDVRSKANTVNAIRIIFILVCVATFFIFYLSAKVRYDSTEGIIIRTIAAGLALLIFVLYKPLFKKLVIKPLVSSFDCHLEYEEEGNVNIEHVRKLEIFGPFEVENRIFFASNYTFTASSEDKFTGILRNIPFQLEELKVEKVTGSGKRERREIMLQSYQIELDTELHPDCTILAFCENAVNTVAVDFIRLHNVFPKGGEPSGWNVFSDNPKNCLDYMQHSAMVNVLKKVVDIGRESLQEEDLVLYIVDGKIRLFIPSRKDRFESAIIGWTSSSKIHKFYTELEGMIKMVDVLASWYINA